MKMSDLRNQLQAARREYEAIRYPGALAADVLRRQPRTFRPWYWLAAPAAVAAAVALAIMLHRPGKIVPHEQPAPVIAVAPEQTAPVIVALVATNLLAPASAGLPGEALLTPPEPALLPPSQSLLAPAVPNLWETSTSDTTEPNMKESV